MTESVRLRFSVDRESVAMGDDGVSHKHEISVEAGTPLSVMLDLAAPEIRLSGWSWVPFLGREIVAVWSVDHGVRLLVEDRPLGPADEHATVFFRYLQQLDPEWLHGRLGAGAPLNQRALTAEFAPIALERHERELRRREREVDAKYLSPECVEALVRLGAVIDLHADAICRFDLAGERWVVSRADTMMQVFNGTQRPPIASIRPHADGERRLLEAVAAAVNEPA